MDKAAERVILDGLAAARPHDAIVSEESAADRRQTGVRWLIDPLDGTVNYLYGIPHYAVSIAAEVDGEMAAGVVLDVERGGRVRRGPGRRERRCDGGRDPLLGPDRSRRSRWSRPASTTASSLRAVQARSCSTILPAVRDIRRIGSAALDLCAVAAGQVDAFFEAGHARVGLGGRGADRPGGGSPGRRAAGTAPGTTTPRWPPTRPCSTLLHHVLVDGRCGCSVTQRAIAR